MNGVSKVTTTASFKFTSSSLTGIYSALETGTIIVWRHGGAEFEMTPLVFCRRRFDDYVVTEV